MIEVCSCILARSPDGFRIWGRFDDASPTIELKPLLILTAGSVLIVIAAGIWNLWSRRSQHLFTSNSSPQLFRELCRAHQLGRTSRRLLKSLAEAKHLDSPAMLFVQPKLFDVAQLPDSLKSASGAIKKLHAQLFATS